MILYQKKVSEMPRKEVRDTAMASFGAVHLDTESTIHSIKRGTENKRTRINTRYVTIYTEINPPKMSKFHRTK